MSRSTNDALLTLWGALGGSAEWADRIRFTGTGNLPSIFAVTDIAAAAIGAACLALSEFIATGGGRIAPVQVDRRMASFWFGQSIKPEGWAIAPPWDVVAGDYEASDGWIRLHTNAPHHRAAALGVLGAKPDRRAVSDAVRRWSVDALESAIVEHNGCAAAMRSEAQWLAHPQGGAVALEPLRRFEPDGAGEAPAWSPIAARPLKGIRVLDMTRVIAGPVATRFLAGFGAEVLRIDSPDWNEPAVVPDMTLGKRCARLDLRSDGGRCLWERLLSRADVLVHGYRPGALSHLGLGTARRSALCPGLVDVSLDAYGWTGPWCDRRGFDSLVQMSSGIAEAGMRSYASDRPKPLPVQALDHTTGYLMAASVLRGLTMRMETHRGSTSRLSLARMASELVRHPMTSSEPLAATGADDYQDHIEETAWGEARRLRPPCRLEGVTMHWEHGAAELGSSEPMWSAS